MDSSATASGELDLWKSFLKYQSGDLEAHFTRRWDILHAASVVPFALIGIVLSRRRGWKVASMAAAIFGTWTLLVFLSNELHIWPRLFHIEQAWRDMAQVFLVALTWLITDELMRRRQKVRRLA